MSQALCQAVTLKLATSLREGVPATDQNHAYKPCSLCWLLEGLTPGLIQFLVSLL